MQVEKLGKTNEVEKGKVKRKTTIVGVWSARLRQQTDTYLLAGCIQAERRVQARPGTDCGTERR